MAKTEVRSDDALFVLAGENTVLPTAFSRGPWNLGSLHGGPVAALLAHAVEQLPSEGVEWFTARLTVELERPVPVEPLVFAAEVTRAGRKVSIVEATITNAATGVVLARARAVRIRSAEVPLPRDHLDLGPLLAIEPAPSEPADGRAAVLGEDAAVTFQHGGTDRRFVGELDVGVGPVFGWIRVRVPLLAGLTLTPLQRVAAAVDFASGISAVLPGDTHSFINPDLTIHVFRAARGEWIGMASATHHSDHGVGMTDTSVFDVDGRVGSSNQSLLLDLR